MTTGFGVCNTYRTMVLRNQGRLAIEGTASSISGCILIKLRVSSGNSLETLYLSIDGLPGQLPGLQIERQVEIDKNKMSCFECVVFFFKTMIGHTIILYVNKFRAVFY